MLKQRIITAAILIPIVLYILFFASITTFRLTTLIVVCLAAWEWPTLMGKTDSFMRLGYVIMLVALMFIAGLLPLPLLLGVSSLGWLILAYWVVSFPNKQEIWSSAQRVGVLGIQIILPCWFGLNYLRQLPHAHSFIFILLLLIWGADSSAYFIGRKYGTKKLIPAVSPNKTWQGFYAALLTGFLVAAISIIWLNGTVAGHWIGFLILGIITTVVSVLGDLTESMIKRVSGVKDSGNILPGHGGIMDRIDSLTAAAPIYALGIMLLGFN